MGLTKAFIQRLGGLPQKPIEVMFNPAEYSLDKSNQFQTTQILGLSTPLTQFVSGNAQTLTMDLFFDTYERQEDVRTYTDRVRALLEIDSELHAPPICQFVWGRVVLKAIVEKVTSKFTMFLGDGTPVRATLNVTFKEYQTLAEQLAAPARHSADRTKMRVFRRGDSLWRMAADEYGDASEWRRIAEANGLDDPLDVAAGTTLRLPPIR